MTRLDETDVKLLKALQKDAKVNTKELCDELNLSRLRSMSVSGDLKMMV